MESHIKDRQLPNGATLQSGQYTIQKVLGQGGFGITYLAQHRTFGEVALKELFLNSGVTYCTRESTTRQQVIPHFDAQQFDLFKKRFEEEARTLYSLRDIQGVVKVLHIFEENSTIYFAMEYLEGVKLEEYALSKNRRPIEDAVYIIQSLGKILSTVHKRKVLHCDIKPANVIIDEKGKVSLIDFGIARSYVDEITETHTTFHSPRYAPPEQKIAKASLGAYSDVYALGATAYYTFTGKVPQSIEERTTGAYIPAQHYLPALPDHIDGAITKCLQFKVEERFQTVDEFLAILSNSTVDQSWKNSTQEKVTAASGNLPVEPQDITAIDISTSLNTGISTSLNTGISTSHNNPSPSDPVNSPAGPLNQGDEATQIDAPAVMLPDKKPRKRFPIVLVTAIIAMMAIVGTFIYLRKIQKDTPPPVQEVVQEQVAPLPQPETATAPVEVVDTALIEKRIAGKWHTADRKINLVVEAASHYCTLNNIGATWHLENAWPDSCEIKVEAIDKKGSVQKVKIYRLKEQKAMYLVFWDADGKLYLPKNRPVLKR